MHAKALAVAATALAVVAHRHVAPSVGQPAPAFAGVETHGRPQSLVAYRGKWVVLEWFNKDCPFVKRHYGTKNMQSLQRAATAKGAVWYAIASSKPGKQGALTLETAPKVYKDEGMAATALLLDPKSEVARLYGAKTTPHMFVIDPKGDVIYMGAIDDHPSTDWSDIKEAHSYVTAALDAAMSGKPVPKGVTTPYGCSVKY